MPSTHKLRRSQMYEFLPNNKNTLRILAVCHPNSLFLSLLPSFICINVIHLLSKCILTMKSALFKLNLMSQYCHISLCFIGWCNRASVAAFRSFGSSVPGYTFKPALGTTTRNDARLGSCSESGLATGVSRRHRSPSGSAPICTSTTTSPDLPVDSELNSTDPVPGPASSRDGGAYLLSPSRLSIRRAENGVRLVGCTEDEMR